MPSDIAACNKSFPWRVAFEGRAWGCLFAVAVGDFLSFFFFSNSSPVIQTRGFIVTYGGEVKEGWACLCVKGTVR